MQNIFNKIIDKAKLLNSVSQYPKIFYARHIGEGVVGYNTGDKEEVFFISTDTLKKMNSSFSGKPVYLGHRDVPLSEMKQNAVGYVVESFYMPEDGKMWLKMIITDDEAFTAINEGWAVSNAYSVKDLGNGGVWHNINYEREILEGSYEHLAIVPDPRYEEAKVFTPEEFKSYKESKKQELEAMSLLNSKDKKNNKENKTMFFTRKEVKTSDGVDLEKVEVQLSNGTSMKLGDIVKEVEAKQKETPIEEKSILVNGKEMKVSELIAAFEALNAKKNEAEDEEKKDKENEKEDKEEKEEKDNSCDKDKENESDEKEDKENEKDEEKEEEKENKKKNSKGSDFDRLLNAHSGVSEKTITVNTYESRLERGRNLYGSDK